MKIGIMQPYFMPYIGYWQRISAVDKHVIYDDVNYIKNGWMNHNRILLNGQEFLFNAPLVGASPNKLINEVGVNNNAKLQNKMIKTLEQAYKKSPYYNETMECLAKTICSNETNFAKYLEFQIKEICAYLGIETELIISSELSKDNSLKGQDKVIEICKKLDASIYYNASTGEHLYDKKTFSENGIELFFIRNKSSLTYKQRGEGFIPTLSIIDVMMNCSKTEIKNLLNDYEIW